MPRSTVTIPPQPLGCRGPRPPGLLIAAGIPSTTRRPPALAPAPLCPPQMLLLPHQTDEGPAHLSRLLGAPVREDAVFLRIAFLWIFHCELSPLWGWGSPSLFPSVFPSSWGNVGEGGEKRFPYSIIGTFAQASVLWLWREAVPILGATSAAKALPGRSQGWPARRGASTVALSSVAAGRPWPWMCLGGHGVSLAPDTRSAGKPHISYS